MIPPMYLVAVVVTMWVAWWGIRVAVASPPTMPQVILDGGRWERQDYVGGLVGYQTNSSITSSYATGNPNGGDRESMTRVGGLVGRQKGGSITFSYATGRSRWGGGDSRTLLVAWWGIRITVVSPPVMPQAVPMEGAGET